MLLHLQLPSVLTLTPSAPAALPQQSLGNQTLSQQGPCPLPLILASAFGPSPGAACPGYSVLCQRSELFRLHPKPQDKAQTRGKAQAASRWVPRTHPQGNLQSFLCSS